MSKTQSFARLKRIASRLLAARRGHGRPPRSDADARVSRRAFGVGLASVVVSACNEEHEEHEGHVESDAAVEPSAVRVAVVGGGLAGCHAAYRLQQAGVAVDLYEASGRVGGRTFTGRGLFAQGHTCELGGELIDSNHRFVHALAAEFDLELVDRFGGDYEDVVHDTWVVAGQVVSEQEITRQFAEVVEAFADAVEAADGDDDEFTRLDELDLGTWLAEVVPPEEFPELSAMLIAAYRGEFGLEVSEQSALNLIYLIGVEVSEGFRIFGESDERYQIRGGNDQIATAMASELGDAVHVGHALRRVRRAEGRFVLRFRTAAGNTDVECDYVVFALPFSKLREVDLDGAGLSEDKRTMIDELGYGTNAKIMSAFSSRVWVQQGASGAITSDGDLQQTWDSSIGQDGEQGILTYFVGGQRGVDVGEGEAETWVNEMLEELEAVHPGVRAAYVEGSAVRMHWPSHEFTRGSYSCYRPGQWAFWGTEGLPEGKMHFCGEHTSPEFQGWMEGAAETGGRVAIEILRALDLPIPEALAEVVDDVTALPGQEL